MNTWHKWCSVLIALMLLISIPTCIERVRYEHSYKPLEIAIPYHPLSAQDSIYTEHNQEQWMKKFIQAGVTTFIVQDTTLEQLQSRQKLTFSAGDDLANSLNQEQMYLKYLTKSSSVIQLNQPSLSEANYYEQMLEDAFKDKLRKIELDNGDPIYIVRGSSKQIASQPLGIDWTQIQYIQKRFPVEIAVQYTNTAIYHDETFMQRQFEILNTMDIHHLVFKGDQAIGYPLQTKWMADTMKAYGMYFNFDRTQQGAKQLAKQSGFQLIRDMTVDPQHLQYLPVKQAASQLADEVTNCALQMITLPITRTDIVTDAFGMLHLTRIIENTLEAVAPHYTAGLAVPLASLDVNDGFAIHRMVAIFGITLLTMLTAYKLTRASSSYWFVLLLSLTCFSAWLLDSSYTVWLENSYALLGIVAAPTLGMILAIERLERWSARNPYTRSSLISYPLQQLIQVIFAFLLCGLITLIGAIFMISFWHDMNYLTEVVRFQGVRLQLIVTILLVGIYLLLQRHQHPTTPSHDSMEQSPKWWFKFSLIITAFGVTIFVLLPISPILGNELGPIGRESGILTFLHPNEWLVGHPLFILASYGILRKRSHYILFIPAMIGQIAMMNAIMHIYTPLLTSISRSIIAMVTGCIIGLILHGIQILIQNTTIRISQFKQQRESHTSL
ncbi:DUF5693 family protein [Paenibacillus guangzhouensis]|uniref:DUF5693 family protein n=1 Tax=Paenibacillus guangzhouensis TaxID=1473112 RepID=UPI0012677C74|nr:DUF5693 family protein [Paenibacillus guangzhouensis]